MNALRDAVELFDVLVACFAAHYDFFLCFPDSACEDDANGITAWQEALPRLEAKVQAAYSAYESAYYAAEEATNKACFHDAQHANRMDAVLSSLKHPEGIRAENKWLV